MKRSGYWREGPLWAQRFGIPQAVVNRGRRRFAKRDQALYLKAKAAVERKAVVAFVKANQQPFDAAPRLRKKGE